MTTFRHYPRTPALIGIMVAGVLLALGLAAMLVLIWADDGRPVFAALELSRLVYSLKSASYQAALSVIMSLGVAIPASIALARRRRWWGMNGFVLIISLAMVLPTTVAATGLLAVWGRNGLVADWCAYAFGGCELSIYGLHGVVLALMMLNVPLMMRVFMPLLLAVPSSQWRLAALLGMSRGQRFRHVELPALISAVPGVSSLVFLLCFTSFALVLMLGGGPKVTTLEVEIYSAIRFDFDLAAAAGLSLIQFACAAVVVAIMAVTSRNTLTQHINASPELSFRKDLNTTDTILDLLVLCGSAVLVFLPMVMVALNGFNPGLVKLLSRPQFWSSLGVSLSISSISAVMVTVLAFGMAQARAHLALPHRLGGTRFAAAANILLDGGVMLYLVIPSVVLGTASFIALRHYGDVFANAFGVVVMANVLLALPFAVRLLERRLTTVIRQQDRLATMLGVSGGTRMRVLTLPVLRHDLAVVMGLTAALSIGDLGVIALFAHDGFKTLPWMLYQLQGKYATGEAAGLALVLMLMTVLMFGAARVIMRLVIGGRYA
ncbi:MAG: ABC transporter permease subunit [Alphaproteobacteria bacterium]|nr:ABC transporter permease subunit [Alphaproteobacteria bacterium]